MENDQMTRGHQGVCQSALRRLALPQSLVSRGRANNESLGTLVSHGKAEEPHVCLGTDT